MFRIIYLRGDVFRIIHRKLKFGGDIWGDLFRIIYLKGDVFRIFFLIGDFIRVNRFFISSFFTYDFIYLINLIGQK